MGDTTLTGSAGVNVLSVHRPAEYFKTGSQQGQVSGGANSGSEPTDFFTPSSLTNRASDLYRLQDSTGNALQSIRNAKAGIEKIQELVADAEAVARDAGALQSETASVSSSVTELTGNETLEQAFGLDTGDSITIGDGQQSITVTADGSTTVDALVSEINADENLDVKASVYVGSLKLEATGRNSITAAVTDNGGGANSLSDIGFTDLGDDVVAEAGSLSLNRLGLANDFNDILDEISSVASASGINGVNLLKGNSLVEKFNSNNIPTIEVNGVDFDTEGLGLTSADNQFQTSVDISTAISELDAAAVTLESQAAIYDANEAAITVHQGFSPGLITALQTGSDLNVSVPDEEVVGLLAEQTKQLISSEPESLTNSETQDVLKGFE